jgi:hypothetical protein
MTRRTQLAATLALLIAAPAALHAQRTFKTIGNDLGYGVGDMFYVWTSPFHASGRDWATAALALAGVGATAALDEDVNRWIVNHPSAAIIEAVDPMRENRDTPLADFGTGRILLPLSGGLYLIGFIADSPKWRDAGMGCAAAQQANSALRHAIYEGVARTRPKGKDGTLTADAFDIDVPGGDWDQHSFFGGHAANAMACATFWSKRYHLGVLEPAMYGLALGIGVARMADQRHWSSDTMLGLIVGHAIGRTIATRSLRRTERREARETVARRIQDGMYVTSVGSAVAVGWASKF